MSLPVAALSLLVCGASPAAEVQLRAGVQQEALSLPSVERLFSAFNPGAEVGAAVTFWRGERVHLLQDLALGVFHHPGFATSPVLRTTTVLRLHPVAGLELDVGLSLGYLAQVSHAAVFRPTADGFAQLQPAWLHRFVGGLALAIGYRVGPVTPYLSYLVLVEAPFLQKFSPIVPHQLLQLGVRFTLPTPGGAR